MLLEASNVTSQSLESWRRGHHGATWGTIGVPCPKCNCRSLKWHCTPTEALSERPLMSLLVHFKGFQSSSCGGRYCIHRLAPMHHREPGSNLKRLKGDAKQEVRSCPFQGRSGGFSVMINDVREVKGHKSEKEDHVSELGQRQKRPSSSVTLFITFSTWENFIVLLNAPQMILKKKVE